MRKMRKSAAVALTAAMAVTSMGRDSGNGR